MDMEYVILGGGIAGLSAAIHLTELGKKPLIIEAGNYPSHKICGEFLSSSCLDLLKKWEIKPILLPSVTIHSGSQNFQFDFPSSAGSLSHLTLDPLLAKRAVEGGATCLLETKVETLKPAQFPSQLHQLLLASGEIIKAKHLIIATGRLPSLSFFPISNCYMGFKTHWTGLSFEPRLEMFTFPGAYLGLSPVENGNYNIACLASLKTVDKFSSPEVFIQQLIQQNAILANRLSTGKNLLDRWLQTCIPSFGLKKIPDWPSTYFIGDAICTIPPACGGGLALALASGYIAAYYATRNNPKKYKKTWYRYCRRPLFFGKILHHLFLHAHLSNWSMQVSRYWPSLPSYFYQLTRDKGVYLKR